MPLLIKILGFVARAVLIAAIGFFLYGIFVWQMKPLLQGICLYFIGGKIPNICRQISAL